MNLSDEKIFEKIQKLLALSNSPNQAEAELAAQKANELLVKYNLSLSDVEKDLKPIEEEGVKEGYRLKPWRLVLFNGIAKVNLCSVIIGKSSFEKSWYELNLVGRKHNIIIARNMFEYLEKTIERVSLSKIRKNAKQRFRNSFRQGMAYAIIYKLEEQFEQETGQIDSERKALIVNLYETEMRVIKSFLESKGLVRRSPKIPSIDKTAFSKGHDAGLDVGIHKQVKGENNHAGVK